MDRLELRPGKGLGQSFLKDETIAARQVLISGAAPGENILEVGGGLGVLTQELARQGCKVRVLEIDPRLVAHLRALRLPGVNVVKADALAADLGRPDRVVANIPYSITTPLLERLVDTEAPTMVLMVQREVAQRLATTPPSKEWSRLGAIVQREYDVEIVESVPPNAFHPQPRVHSAMVRLRRHKSVDTAGRAAYRELVGSLFASRRRKVRNTVAAAAARLHQDSMAAQRAAESLGLADHRPEELSVADFEALVAALAPKE